MIEIGGKAPDFALKDQNGKLVKLSNFKGKKVILSFRPLAWTSVCHDQMKNLDNNFSMFNELNTVALGIGVDSSPCNKAWAQSMEIENTRLLADFWPHGQVANSYGVFREKDGFAERANIIVDENQKVIYVKLYPVHQLPDFEEIISFLRKQ